MTTIMQISENIVSFKKQKKLFIKELKSDLNLVLKEIFSTIPEIKSIYWIQYTPYFMDGDTCEFSIHDIIVSNTEEALATYPGDDCGDDSIWADSADDVEKEYVPNAIHRKLLKNFSALINKSGDLIQEVFGDHVRVIGTKTGFKVQSYEHE